MSAALLRYLFALVRALRDEKFDWLIEEGVHISNALVKSIVYK